MNKRYEELKNKIRLMHSKGADKNLMQAMFSLANPNHSEKVDDSENLKNKTKYSHLEPNTFMNLFSSKSFAKHSDENLKHLFQELHNRYIKSNGYEVSRNVVVGNDSINKQALGYVTASDDVLFINKTAIEKASQSISPNNLNKVNLGLVMSYVITHESQHITQFENAIDFVLNKDQDKMTKFIGAIMAIEQTNLTTASNHLDIFYIKKWKKNYNHHYIEHNANYSAFKSMEKNLDDEQKKSMEYNEYAKYTGILALRGLPMLSGYTFVNKRVKNIEKFLNYEIKYFTNKIEDCPLKQQILETVNEYMKVDSNGKSEFRTNLKTEINEILDKTINEMYKSYATNGNAQSKKMPDNKLDEKEIPTL